MVSDEAERCVSVIGKGNANLALWKCCKNGMIEFVKLLLQNCELDINWKNENYHHYSPLHVSCQKGHGVITRLLVEVGGAEINTQGVGGETPLHEAIHEKHQLLALYLVRHGGDLNKRSKYDKTPYDFAVANGFAEMLDACAEDYSRSEIQATQLKKSLAEEIVYRSMDKREANLLRTEMMDMSRITNERDMVLEELFSVKHLLESQKKVFSARTAILEDELQVAHSRRRKTERLLADSEVENSCLGDQVSELQACLEGAYQDNNRLDEYIQTSYKVVAKKNQNRIMKKNRESPRSIKLRTFESRLVDAESRAYEAFESKQKIEGELAAARCAMTTLAIQATKIQSHYRGFAVRNISI